MIICGRKREWKDERESKRREREREGGKEDERKGCGYMEEGGVRYACQCVNMCESGPDPTNNGHDRTVSRGRGSLELLAASHPCTVHAASRTCVPNSTPMVGFPSRNAWPSLSSTNRCIRCDLPTPESPTRTTAYKDTQRAR
jgi:hypothetical protein